jgi:hypothetical protein
MGGERRLESYVMKRATVNTESPPSRKIPKIAKGGVSSIYEKFGVIIFLTEGARQVRRNDRKRVKTKIAELMNDD